MCQSILVTGGAGFIGSGLVRQWLTAGRGPVVVLDKLTYAGSREALDAVADDVRFTFAHGDIADRGLVRQLLAQHQPQAIINLAAESHVERSIDKPGPFVDTNIVGTWQLLESALEYWQLLSSDEAERFRYQQVSTDEVYGDLPEPTSATELSPYAPNSPYAAAKAAADHLVRAYHRTYGLPTLVTCSSNNYGPFQFPEKLVPIVIQCAIEGRPIPVYGDGLQRRDWIHVDDNCAGLTHVLEQGRAGESYNLASGSALTNLELVEAVCQEVDRQLPDLPHRPTTKLRQHVADRPGHDRRYALDTSKAQALGWQPEVPLANGITETVTWYRENREWVESMLARVDQSQRLGQRGVPNDTHHGG
ncbi:MAG: dTDP-glucose 4,6-dehydratase [Aeoliella sp.]